MRKSSRFVVVLEQYSLEPNKVGHLTGVVRVVSSHRSILAAGRVLGSVISGKRRALAKTPTGTAMRYYVLDNATNQRYTRNDCLYGATISRATSLASCGR